MERVSLDETSKSSRESSLKDLNISSVSLKSTKSLEKSSTSGSFKLEKNYIHFKNDQEGDNQKLHSEASLKVPHKIIANWRQACDKTKDKTKDLLKRWRTLPEIEAENAAKKKEPNGEKNTNVESGWSVHIWTTWVDRFSIDSAELNEKKCDYQLTPIQSDKLSHFFTCLLDHDHDNLISEQDFETLTERFRHFADWSENSSEFNILREVERGFIETFLHEISNEKLGFQVNNQTYLTKDGWLYQWSELISGAKNLNDFPVWLQVFSKVLFQVINRNGNGIISRDELSAFYSSVLGLGSTQVGQILDLAYQSMTSKGDHPLRYSAYRLCFANYLLGRFPNGPGYYLLGAPPSDMCFIMFPVDYSALNTQPEDLEQYTPDQKSNRRSVIV